MNESNAMALADNAMGAVDWDALHERSRAIFDAVHRGSSLALQSGLYGAPPERPDMTRALPNYDQRDPNELAMLRHREMARPQAGRQDFPIEHVANMASAAAALSPVGMALAPEFMAGRGLAAAAHYAPKLTTAGLVAGGAMAPSMAGGAENQQATRGADPQAIKDLQIKLKDAGLYRGEVDGIMRPGGPTEQALKQFQEREAASRAEDLKRRELDTQQGANTAALETARANQATAAAKLEADRLKAEKDAADLERKRLGDERMKELEANVSPMSRVIRDYSGPAGMALGAIVGAGTRYGIKSANDAFAKTRAASADAAMAEEMAAASGLKGTAKTAAQDAINLKRVARANEFWLKGGAKEVPFNLTPGSAPGFAANPNVTPLKATYNPNVHPAVEGAATAVPLSESLWADHKERETRDELAAAQKAFSEDQSEVNIQRIQAATDRLAIYSGLSNAGRVAAGTIGAGALQSRFMSSNPALRPNMAAAEAEQLSLQKALRDAQAKLDAAAKKAGKKAPSVLEQRSMELGVGPTPPAFTGSAATRARQVY